MLSVPLNDVSVFGLGAALLTILASYVASFIKRSRQLSCFPIVNPSKSKDDFVKNAHTYLKQGSEKFDSRPFRIVTNDGARVILPSAHIDFIKNDDRFNFDEVIKKDFFSSYPEFRSFESVLNDTSGLLLNTIRVKLTQNLTKVTSVLCSEISQSLDDRWGTSEDWHTVSLHDDIAKFVARMSTRTFVGEQLAHDQEWIDIAISYTLEAFFAARALRMWPAITRPFIHWFLPECKTLRAQLRRAHTIINDLVTKRQAEREKGWPSTDGKAPNDTLEWMEELRTGDVDFTAFQLQLSLAAIHTTSDLLKQCILDITQQPGLIDDLRKEITGLVAESGWEKTTLYKMQLLDSVMKETQRLKPPGKTTMNRIVMSDVTLPDGSFLPKGTTVVVSSDRMTSETVHSEPQKYDGYRFLKLRQQEGRERTSQFVSTSVDHPAFGHGKHSCPGRFFASNEVKIALANILCKYDIRVEGGKIPKPMPLGFEYLVDPSANIQVKRRSEETDLEVSCE